MTTSEQQIEHELIAKLSDLKYSYRPDIRDRAALEANFREKFEALNRVRLTDSEFRRLLDGIVMDDVYSAAQILRNINSFERDDGTPLNYTLVNIRDWCKNDFEVVNQLRINTDNSYHRYDVMLLINGVPVVQIELKTLAVSPRRAMRRSSITRPTPVMATARRCSLLSSCSLSATAATPATSPTTTPAISVSTPTNASCPSTSSLTRTTRRSPTWMPLLSSSSPSAPWVR